MEFRRLERSSDQAAKWKCNLYNSAVTKILKMNYLKVYGIKVLSLAKSPWAPKRKQIR